MARSRKQAQALAIKLSRERRAGKLVPPPNKGEASETTRRKAMRDLEVGREKLKRSKRTAKAGARRRSR